MREHRGAADLIPSHRCHRSLGSSNPRHSQRSDSPASSPQPSPLSWPNPPKSLNIQPRYGLWDKGKSWSSAVTLFSIFIIVSFPPYAFGVTGWAVAVSIGSFALALLLISSTGLVKCPDQQGCHDIENATSEDGYFSSPVNRLDSRPPLSPKFRCLLLRWIVLLCHFIRLGWRTDRLMLQPVLFITFRFADFTLTVFWRMVWRATPAR